MRFTIELILSAVLTKIVIAELMHTSQKPADTLGNDQRQSILNRREPATYTQQHHIHQVRSYLTKLEIVNEMLEMLFYRFLCTSTTSYRG